MFFVGRTFCHEEHCEEISVRERSPNPSFVETLKDRTDYPLFTLEREGEYPPVFTESEVFTDRSVLHPFLSKERFVLLS